MTSNSWGDLEIRRGIINTHTIWYLIIVIILRVLYNPLSLITAPCEKATYDVGIQTYDSLSRINIKKENDTKTNQTQTTKKKPPVRRVFIYYSTNDVKVSTTSKLIDLHTFISNIGGNLGLFVGFSFLSGLFCIYDLVALRRQYIEQVLSPWIH